MNRTGTNGLRILRLGGSFLSLSSVELLGFAVLESFQILDRMLCCPGCV